MALAAYRHVLRSARIAFRGDARLLIAARDNARYAFESQRLIDKDSEAARNGIAHAEEIATLLRHNVVQGERREEDGVEKYKLRIHDDIERGDNESIKVPGGMGTLAPGQCCGGGDAGGLDGKARPT